MNKSLYFLLLVAIVVSGFFSCSIQKRIYRSGYSIEWNTRDKFAHTATNSEKQYVVSSQDEEMRGEQTSSGLTLPNSDFSNEKVSVLQSDSPQIEPISKRKQPKEQQYRKSIQSKNTQAIPVDDPHVFGKKKERKKIEGDGSPSVLAFVSLGFALLGFVFYIPALIGLIVGAMCIRQYRESPGEYGHIWMPITAIVVGFLACLLGLIVAFYFIAFFSSVLGILVGAVFLLLISAALLIMSAGL